MYCTTVGRQIRGREGEREHISPQLREVTTYLHRGGITCRYYKFNFQVDNKYWLFVFQSRASCVNISVPSTPTLVGSGWIVILLGG